jgi:hypothetical protein
MRRKPAAIATAAVLVALALWRWGDAGDVAQASAAAPLEAAATGTVPAGGAGAPVGGGSTSPFSAAGLASREQQLQRWQQRYTRAEAAYNSYRDATRYPPESRPLAEHADQQRPLAPVTEETALRDDKGRPAAGLRLRTTQERVFLAGEESSRFSIEMLDPAGRPVPLTVRQAAAVSLGDSAALAPQVRVPVRFGDDGKEGDTVEGDGRHGAVLSPARQGFAGYAGTIRVRAEVSAAGHDGVVAFDVVYTPGLAGTWVGVREALEDGALNFYLKAQLAAPGRYVATARVFDAEDKPVALLQFNGEAAAGTVEFRLPLAGVLVRDLQPVFPLRLTDVEAFLLRPTRIPTAP